MDTDFPCPHCGEMVPQNARFCRECGADDTSGWDEHPDTDYDNYEAESEAERDSEYNDFVRREFPDQAPHTSSGKNPWLVIVVVLLLLSMLAFMF